jgi:hypothetical protein
MTITNGVSTFTIRVQSERHTIRADFRLTLERGFPRDDFQIYQNMRGARWERGRVRRRFPRFERDVPPISLASFIWDGNRWGGGGGQRWYPSQGREIAEWYDTPGWRWSIPDRSLFPIWLGGASGPVSATGTNRFFDFDTRISYHRRDVVHILWGVYINYTDPDHGVAEFNIWGHTNPFPHGYCINRSRSV